jgi:hypothetical protein
MMGYGGNDEKNQGAVVVGFVWIGVSWMLHGGQRNGWREYTGS